MFCCKQSCRLLVRSVNLSKNYTIPVHRRHYISSKIKFFTKILEFPTPSAAKQFLQKNDCVMKMDQNDVFDSFKYLTNIGITIDDIRKQPNILCSKANALRNRHEILTECGCSTVNAFCLNKYNHLSNSTEISLKKIGIIDSDIDLQQRLADCLNVSLHPCNKEDSLTAIRMHFLQLFYLQNNFMTAEEFKDAIRLYPFAKHKSYRSIKQIIKILTDEFRIPADKIKTMFHALQADPDNLQKLLTIEPIAGVAITEILQLTPTLILAPYETVQNTLTELKKSGISEESITKCFRVLTMNSNVVQSRLAEMKSKKELQAIKFHPGILKVVVHKFKALNRLNYLHELDKKCFNISVLTGNLEQFEKFTLVENDKNLPRDCVLFLAKILKQEPENLKKEVSRHPYWLYIPFTDMMQTIDMLKGAGFGLKDIYANIHIVLYSGELILSRLKKLNETEQIGGHFSKDLSKAMQLKLVLYLIETEFHFSGDGVWLDRKSNLNFD